MVCGPNVLAMTSPCDNTHALDRLAEVLHALGRFSIPDRPLHPPRTCCPPRRNGHAVQLPKPCCGLRGKFQ